jgi:glycosyltransferase involved in cell wall biosynthesis
MREVIFLKLHVTKQAPRLDSPASHEVDNNLFLIVGRIAPAKGPEFACAVARELYNLDKECEIVWMGGVDKSSNQIIQDLSSAGIRIEEWSSNSTTCQLMTKCCSVLITSSWESGPLVLFEALGQKTPVIARTIPAISLYGFETFANPLEFAQEMVRMKLSLTFRNQVLVEQSEKVATILGRYPTDKLTLT